MKQHQKGHINPDLQELLKAFPNTSKNELEPDARSMWLYDFGLLTPDFLEKVIYRIYLIDYGIRYVDLDYDKFKGNITFKIALRKWHWWFRKNKIFQKLLTFIDVNLFKFDCKIVLYVYDKKKFARAGGQ